MSANPYEAPKARVAEPVVLRTDIAIAGQGARFVNYLLDWAFATLATFLIGLVIGTLGYTSYITRMNRIEEQLVSYLVYVAYYFALELTFGWTLAKLITGTRVVDERGARPSAGKLLGRSFARIVPFEPFSFFGKTGVGWHDRWSGTRVISLRRKEGPTLENSFQPGFDGSTPKPSAPATQAFVPSDGPPAWCPNCSVQIAATSEKCAACGADFSSPDGWKPLESRP
jgi:uncharacterized RDD family membrane protein YckC